MLWFDGSSGNRPLEIPYWHLALKMELLCFFDYAVTNTLAAKSTVSHRPESLIYTLSNMTSISNLLKCKLLFWVEKSQECFLISKDEKSTGSSITFFPRHIAYGKIIVVWFWHIPVLLVADSEMVKVWNTHFKVWNMHLSIQVKLYPQKSNKHIL